MKAPTLPASALLALLVAAGPGCGRKEAPAAGAGAAPAPTKVILQTDWYAEPEHGGFYEALLKGYYREAGLDVEIDPGGPNAAPVQRVATGSAAFAIGRSDDVEVAVSRGIPVVMVGALMQRDPQAIMFHAESGIRTFKDLDGRNIMAVPGSSFITIMEKTYGIKVGVIPLDFGLSRFMADKNFVQQCFITNEPYYVRKLGAKVGVLLLSDSGFSPYRVWYTSRRFIEEHPDAVRAFTQASIRGWKDYIGGDVASVNARLAELNPKMDAPFMAYCVQTMQENHLVTGDPAAGEAVGRIRRERVAHELQQLKEIGQIDRPLTVDDVFDGRFLSPAPAAP